MNDMHGKTVLVTGASRGIGLAIAEHLLAQGATVLLHARGHNSAMQALADSAPDRVHCILGDLIQPHGPDEVWQRAVEAVERVDVLVNNAGAWLASPIDGDADWQQGWEANLALNLTAPAALCRLALLHFRQQGGGIIINITSRSAHRGDDAEHLAYGAAKGGLLALTKGIARGYGRDNILAYAIAPAWVATELAAGAIAPEVLAQLPLGEVTPATDVAAVVAFLASGRARHTTGATIDITGADYVR